MYSTVKQINLARRVLKEGTILHSFVPKNFHGSKTTSGDGKKEDSPIYFHKFLTERYQEASRSLVVRVPDSKSWRNFKNMCSSIGQISNMFLYEINSQNFVLVEMSTQNELLEVLKISERKDKNSNLSVYPYQDEFGFYIESKKQYENQRLPMIYNNIPLKVKNLKSVLNNLSSNLSISAQIEEMYHQMKVNDLGTRLKFLLCKQMQRVINGLLSDATVYPFGSSVSGFGVNGCDLDLVIVHNNSDRNIISSASVNIERPVMQSQLEIISDIAKFFLNGYENVQFIRHARVPIVKFRHWFTDIDCDLSMYCESGVQMSQLLFTLSGLDERIRPLIFIVRLWAKKMLITQEQPNNSITNFSLTLLVIFFLQQDAGLSLPSFDTFPHNSLFLSHNIVNSILKSYVSQQKGNKKSIEELLHNFFHFYSTFNFKLKGCCVKTGKIIEKNDSHPIYIKNPLNSELNVSRNVGINSVVKFQDLASAAAEIIENFQNTKNAATEITIGDVRKTIKPTKKPQYSPHKYLSMGQLSQNTLRHLRWMLQKDILKQDIFLIGHPGPGRRHLAMIFLEMAGREVEYVSLSRDTTEADLKQRREILGGTARYFDQNAVRAAIEGRVLLLEGIEKAERNVLPVLNNLLENREMHLEDGRFLIPATRYDKLLKEHTKEELDKWKLVRVSEDFRVIALGLPVPKYSGNPLDPPLRSRFQARNISPSTFHEQMLMMKEIAPNADVEKISQLLSCGHALLSEESLSLGLPDFPVDNVLKLGFILKQFPDAKSFDLFYRMYPYNSMLQKEQKEALQHIFKSFDIKEKPSSGNFLTEVKCSSDKNVATCIASLSSKNVEARVPCGLLPAGEVGEKYIPTKFQENLIVELLQSHSVSDFCLMGPRGCGKSATILRLANLLNYETEQIVLYQDITSRDLIQQRNTLPNGDTVWNNSPLIQAALDGKLAILDGIDQVHPSTLSVIHSLVHDRDVQLYDGTRLVRHDRYEDIKTRHNLSDEEMSKSQILKVHPSFRIVATANPFKKGVTPPKWLSPEMLSLFLFHEMRPLSYAEERHIIEKLYGSINEKVEKVLNLAASLRSSDDSTLTSLSWSFSTRQLLRMSKKLTNYPSHSVYETIQKACLARFLPPITKEAFENALQKEGIELETREENKSITCEVNDRTVKIGTTEVSRYETKSKSKVPDILFYDIPQHLELLEWLMQDFALGEHLLLVGNQGVGKNKIADRLLQLLNRPREYIQLHRDTTVQTLTLQPTIKDGIVSYEDSPLVQAVKLGHVLIIDEADKAPTHVTCILKTLVERNEMTLSDGRKIIPPGDKRRGNERTIEVHPDFRIIVLANRPGFPFLGNDFFGALGDLFSCHAVDNPSTESEISLLKQYGPNVSESTILNLVKAFGELREMADKGLVQYPYSTREVVNVVKHLQSFPNEGITDAVNNVFDFDKYSSNVLDTIVPVLQKHGIPINRNAQHISLAREFPLPEISNYGVWNVKRPSTKKEESVTVRNIKMSKSHSLGTFKTELDITEARGSLFTEMRSFTTLPLPPRSIVLALAATKNENSNSDTINILAINPFRLYVTSSSSPKVKIISLDSFIPKHLPGLRFKFTITPFSGHLAGTLFIHEESTNDFLIVDTYDNSVKRIDTLSVSDKLVKKFDASSWELNGQLSKRNTIILYTLRDGKIQVLDFNEMKSHTIQIPFEIKSLHVLSDEVWLIQSYDKKKILLRCKSPEDSVPSVIEEITENSQDIGTITETIDFDLGDEVLSQMLNKKISSPNRLLVTNESYAAVAVGLPDLELSDVYCWPRSNKGNKWRCSKGKSIFLSDSSQLVSCVSDDLAPDEIKRQSMGSLGFLEVLDFKRRTLQYIAVPEGSRSWYVDNSALGVFMDKITDDRLVTVDYNGNIRFWETGYLQLQRSLDHWQKMVGKESGSIRLTIERASGKDVSQPKHGKVDPDNKPHFGGGTWAGGTGGRDTAGLGGKGGPYRLDAGHDVYQIPDFEKNNVPEEVRQAAREMGKKAFKQRLKEIKMSQYDHELYESYYQPVAQQIKMLKVVIESVEAKSKEREWVRHQTAGDLDDLKLIEGLTGEKTIYRRRIKKEPDPGTPQTKPKRLKLVADVSGSMYRFNGYDGRLNRMLEASVLLMEAFENQEAKFKYDITGHSGDGYNFNFVDPGNPPKNNKERLEVIKTMHAHAQFCMSGDHTLPATMHAIESVSKEDCDEAIVIVLSDANLDRYGIKPSSFGRILTSNPDVNAYAILIGSLGDQASWLVSTLPAGRAFVCMDLSNIPQIMRQIFTTSVLSSD